jgi:RNA polymerase sigma factor (sigma-70 family)
MSGTKDSQNIVSDSWQKFRQGNHAVLGEIFQNLYKELYFYGLKLVAVPDLVKDTIQDIFTDVWDRRQKMNGVDNIKAYLFVSVRRKLLKRIEKLRNESFFHPSLMEPMVFSTEDFIVKEETDSQVIVALVQSLKKLTERQREVVLLRFNHELEFQEIAMVMDMNVQSARNLLFRALENIRRDMNASGITGSSDIEMFLLIVFQKKKVRGHSLS